MKKILLTILLLILSYNVNFAQKLKVIRNDVDTNRSSFITATYLFSIDLSIDSIQNCYGSNIHISYNQSKYINLSAVRYGDVWDKSASVVIPKVDTTTNKGDIIIGVLTNDFANKLKPAPIKIITLEFAVSQNAPYGQAVTLTFPTAQGFVLDTNNNQKVIELITAPISYYIHGFVNVWPGDANNDKVVDVTDITNIGLYLNFGQRHLDSRTFSRQYSSTNWTSQRCLAWDSSLVTFSDCDGNGEVNINDLLVVPVNFTKRHNFLNSEVPKLKDEINYDNDSRYERYPISVNTIENMIAFAGTIDLQNLSEHYTILGIESGNVFSDSYTFSAIEPNTKSFIFTTGSYQQESALIDNTNNIIANLVLEPKNYTESLPKISFSQLRGIDSDGKIYDLNQVLSADDLKNDQNNMYFQNNKLFFGNQNCINSDLTITVFNVLGDKLLEQKASISCESFLPLNNIEALQNGVYIISISSAQYYKAIKILIE